MIYGIGTDIVQIGRIEAAIERHGERFAERILGVEEFAVFQQRRVSLAARGARYLATRFAAKEAFSKALGLGMQAPMSWRAMQTLNAASGKPEIVLSGALGEFFKAQGLNAQISITDESEYAVAFVIVEKTN